MYNVIIETEVQDKLEELRSILIQTQGDKKGERTFNDIISTIDNLQNYEIGTSIRERFFIDCPSNWYVLYSHKNLFIFSRTKDTVKVLKMYNEREDFIFDLFGVEMRSQESKDFWGE